jgi:hypothetical protein
MHYKTIWLLGAMLALSACGGGGSGGSAPAATPPPPASGMPTASITNTQTAANDLAKTGASGAATAVSASKFSTIPMEQMITSVSNAIAVNQVTPGTYSRTEPCADAGTSLSYTFTLHSSTGLSAGDGATLNFMNCTLVTGYALNGTITFSFTRYVSASDFAFSLSTSNFTSVTNGVTIGPFNSTGSYDLNNGVITTTYVTNGVTVVGQPQVTVNGTLATITSGTVHTYYGSSGWVDCTYNTWGIDNTPGKAVSGSITITAANGDKTVITAMGGNYQVDITTNGGLTSYTYTVPM